MNEWRGRGGLVRDLKVEDVQGIMKASFTLAVNGTRFDRSRGETVVKTTYVSCEAWGYPAEVLYQSGVGQGCEVYVVGELTQTQREGENRAHTRVAVLMAFVTRMSRRAQDGGNAGDNQQAPPSSAPWGSGQ